MERRNNSLFSLLMTHDSCGRGAKGGGKRGRRGETEGSFSDRARKMANYPWFPEIRGGPFGPCPAKYSAGCMHFPPRRRLLECPLALCADVFGCVQSAYVWDESCPPGEVLVQIYFILVLRKKCPPKSHWATLQPDKFFPQEFFKFEWS